MNGPSRHQLHFTQLDPLAEELIRQLGQKGWRYQSLCFRRVVYHQVELVLKDWDLLVVTSKRAAHWLLQQGQSLPPLAVVGASTSAMLAQHELLFAEGPPAGGNELVTRPRPRLDPETRVLFVSGERVSSAVEEGLDHCQLQRQVVYHTERDYKKFIPPQSGDMVYFQSPSSVEDYQEQFPEPPNWIGVIGSTTRRAVERLGWKVHFQPQRPENAFFVAEVPSPEKLKNLKR